MRLISGGRFPRAGMAGAKVMRTHARARAREREADDPEHPYNVVALRRHQFGLGYMEGQIRRIPSLAARAESECPEFCWRLLF